MSFHYIGYRAAPAVGGIAYVGGDVGNVNGTSIALTLPTHATDHYAIIHAHGDRGSADISITGATGWTEEVDESNNTGRLRRYAIFTKRFTSASETNPTVTFGASDYWGAQVVVFSGVDTTTAQDATLTKSNGSPGLTPTPPGITTVTNNACLVTFGGWTHDDITDIVAPSGLTLAEKHVAANSSELHNNIGSAYQLDAGTAGAKTFSNWGNTGTLGNGDYSLLTMALRPA